MKKYFVSYVCRYLDTKGFGNCIKTSLKTKIDFSDILFWEEEISNKRQFDKVCILNYKEIK